MLEELLTQVSLFADKGFTPFIESWEQMDGLRGQRVSVSSGQSILQGTVVGIDANGALLLDTGVETLSLYSGEVSLQKLI